jgi:hypothetical protein
MPNSFWQGFRIGNPVGKYADKSVQRYGSYKVQGNAEELAEADVMVVIVSHLMNVCVGVEKRSSTHAIYSSSYLARLTAVRLYNFRDATNFIRAVTQKAVTPRGLMDDRVTFSEVKINFMSARRAKVSYFGL